jgi:8-oxo-dGTP pyrophosphatase MutT (NUDIX family)
MNRPTREAVRRALSDQSVPVVSGTGLTPAAVLILIYGSGEESTVLLSKRSEALETHPGEISFPGGRREAADSDLLQTALREAHEEVGVAPGDVEVLGELGQFSTSSDFVISAFVGTIGPETGEEPYEFTVNHAEVSELVEMPVRELMNHHNLRDDVRVVDGDLTVMPAFSYAGHLIFGATARILDRLIEALARGNAWAAVVGDPACENARVPV